jgi:hypothetical protein
MDCPALPTKSYIRHSQQGGAGAASVQPIVYRCAPKILHQKSAPQGAFSFVIESAHAAMRSLHQPPA